MSSVETINSITTFLPEDIAKILSTLNQSNQVKENNDSKMEKVIINSNNEINSINSSFTSFNKSTEDEEKNDNKSINKQIGINLPRECNTSNRKRNYVIGQLLESKKCRYDLDVKISEGNSNQGSMLDRLNYIGEEDTETNSSLASMSSQNSTIISPNNSPNTCIKNDNNTLTNSINPSDIFENNANLLILYNKIPLNILQMGKASGKDQGVTEFPVMNVPNDKIFAQVPGRLSLLSNVVKYKMTVSEIRRRLLGPESFNFSLLGALLRRAKMPAKSQALVTELGEIGLYISRGRRRISNVTLLSALTEAEALVLAKDFSSVSKQHFPVKEIAEDANKKFIKDYSNGCVLKKENVSERINKLKNAIEIFEEISHYMLADRSPILDQEDPSILPEKIQEQLSHYSMLTHGFGSKALLVGMQVGIKYINAVLTDLNESIVISNVKETDKII
uniref:TF_AP-2 domain-containing protein n=1 Tax=Parastrongyloides trichosuri TaxID=131310 RepID=A0A0N4ZHY6_PARTI